MTTRGPEALDRRTADKHVAAAGAVVPMTLPGVAYRRRADDVMAGGVRSDQTSPVWERQIVRAVMVGDGRAWDRLVETYLPGLWAHALTLVGRRTAPAVCELVWLRIAQDPSILEQHQFKAWLRAAVEQAARALPVRIPEQEARGSG